MYRGVKVSPQPRKWRDGRLRPRLPPLLMESRQQQHMAMPAVARQTLAFLNHDEARGLPRFF